MKKFEFGTQILEFTNDDKAQEPIEMLMYDSIGKDPWTGTGITCENMRSALNEVCPNKDRDLHVRINSKGGKYSEGVAIRNFLSEWPKEVSGTYDGVAASAASWLLPPEATVRAFKNSQVFMHEAMVDPGPSYASELRDLADKADKTSDQIAEMYAERSGKGKRTMRAAMEDETLLTGEEAEEMGLVDEIIDGKAVRNFSRKEMRSMKNQLRAFYNSVAKKEAPAKQNTPKVMNKEQMLALLKKHGVSIDNNSTDEQLQAALEQLLNTKKETAATSTATQAAGASATNATATATTGADDIKKLREDIAKLTEANNAAKQLRITNEIDKLIGNDQIPATLKDEAIADCMENEGRLDSFYRKLPSKPPGAAPVSSGAELVSEALNDVQNYVLNNGPRFREQFLGANAGRSVDASVCAEISRRSTMAANAIIKHKSKIIDAWNANAIDTQLQRQVILQDMVEAYAIVVINLDVFSTVYNSVPLEGTDKIEVPYFPLQGTASTSFVKGTGYTTSSDWTQNSREISVGGDGNAATSGTNAAANTARDRKYQMINFASYDLRRQPYLMLTKLFQQAANKLGVDIFTDIISRVITAASFVNSSLCPQWTISADDIAGYMEVANGLNWPQMNRSLVIDHRALTPLVKDTSFKQYLAYGSTDPIRKGRIEEAYGFEDIVPVPNLQTYMKAGENGNGFFCHKSAALVATSPIMPTEEVRHLLTRYDVIIEPKTGIAFEYRRFGDAVKDQTNEVVESSYGAGKGVDAALVRLTSA